MIKYERINRFQKIEVDKINLENNKRDKIGKKI